MRTTLNLPDDLMRAVKIRAVEENRRLTDVIADLLRRGLAAEEPSAPEPVRSRVRLPLVRCTHPARVEEGLTPDRIAAILLAQDASDAQPS